MKTYKEVTQGLVDLIERTDLEGVVIYIPKDPRNSDYAEYLRYTEWVEAGNNPEDFWVQEQQADALVTEEEGEV